MSYEIQEQQSDRNKYAEVIMLITNLNRKNIYIYIYITLPVKYEVSTFLLFFSVHYLAFLKGGCLN